MVDCASSIFPAQVWHICHRSPGLYPLHQLQHRFLGGVTTDDKINLGILDQLLIEVAGREAAKDGRRRGMELLDNLG